jgi:hypothetical protein
MLIYLPSIKNKGGRNKGALTKRTINFGIKPSKGGIPPKERSVKATAIFTWPGMRFEEEMSFGVLVLLT